jgi:hypothetical protein
MNSPLPIGNTSGSPTIRDEGSLISSVGEPSYQLLKRKEYYQTGSVVIKAGRQRLEMSKREGSLKN